MKDWMELAADDFDEKWPYESLILRSKLHQWEAEKTPTNKVFNGNLKDKNYWIWGPPGTGKSRWARSQGEFLNVQIYPKACNKWWGGFQSRLHKIVLFEDFPHDGNYLSQLMKIWADRYEFTGEIKCSSVAINPKDFFNSYIELLYQ